MPIIQKLLNISAEVLHLQPFVLCLSEGYEATRG